MFLTGYRGTIRALGKKSIGPTSILHHQRGPSLRACMTRAMDHYHLNFSGEWLHNTGKSHFRTARIASNTVFPKLRFGELQEIGSSARAVRDIALRLGPVSVFDVNFPSAFGSFPGGRARTYCPRENPAKRAKGGICREAAVHLKIQGSLRKARAYDCNHANPPRQPDKLKSALPSYIILGDIQGSQTEISGEVIEPQCPGLKSFFSTTYVYIYVQ